MKKSVFIILLLTLILAVSCGNQPAADPVSSQEPFSEVSEPTQRELNAYKKKFTSVIRSLNPNKMEDFSVTISQYMTEDNVYTTTDKDLIKKWVDFFKKLKVSATAGHAISGGIGYSFTYHQTKTKKETFIFCTCWPEIFLDPNESPVMLHIDNMDEVRDELESLKQQMNVEEPYLDFSLE